MKERKYPCVINLSKSTQMILRTPEKNNKIEVECRTVMTSISYEIDCTHINPEILMTKCKELYLLHSDIIERCADHDFAWSKLGYFGVMFLDWLASAKRVIETDSKCDPLILKVYINGVKDVDNQLNTVNDC